MGDTTAVTVTEAANAFLETMDDQGYFPEDEEYSRPIVDEEAEDELEVEDELEADAEDQEEVDEDASDEVSEEDEESEDESEDRVFEVVIGEEVYEVNEEELKAGYLRNEEYVSRLAALQQEHEERLYEIETKESELADALQDVIAQAASELGQFGNVNWAQLKETDPERYREAKLAYMEAQERAQAQASKRKAIVDAHAKLQDMRRQKALQGQMEIAKKLLPDFEKPEFHQALVKYGKDIGLTEDEVRGIADARHLVLLDKARRYDELQVKKRELTNKKVSKDLPPVVKPGAPKAAGQERTSRVKQARAQLGKSGSIKDAASLFLARGIFD
jgi:hypothetical protein